jgi:multidrug efflux pump
MGAGANARHSIGTGIIGGMIGETTLAMLYVPLLFYLFDKLAERGKSGHPMAAESPGGGGSPATAPHTGRRDD